MTILIAEDDPLSRHLLQVSLGNEGYEVISAGDGDEALQALEQKDGPKLAILDWMMPKIDGVEVCRAIRKRAAEPYVYILLVTAKGRKEEIIEGLEAGADDYLTKPFDLHELKARLRAGKRIVELQEQLIAAREQLRIEATHDALTSLLSRAAILGIVQKEMARSVRHGTPLAVIMADLDHFKHINDTHGHVTGDAVLKEVARRIGVSLRCYDSVGRYGGEEFLIVSPGCNLGAATALAERIRQCICRETIELSDGPIAATLSLGVAAASGAGQAEELLRAADEALYRAKSQGRNRVEATPSQ